MRGGGPRPNDLTGHPSLGGNNGPFPVECEQCTVSGRQDLTEFQATICYPADGSGGPILPLAMYMTGQAAYGTDQRLMEIVASLGFVAVSVAVQGFSPQNVEAAYLQRHRMVRDFLECRSENPDDMFGYALWPQSVFMGHSAGGGGAVRAAQTINEDDEYEVVAVVSLAPPDIGNEIAVDLGPAHFLGMFGTHDVDSQVQTVLGTFSKIAAASSQTIIGLTGVGHDGLGPSPNTNSGTDVPGLFWQNTDELPEVGLATRDFVVSEFLRKVLYQEPNLLDEYIWNGANAWALVPAGGLASTTMFGTFFHQNPELEHGVKGVGIVPDRSGAFFEPELGAVVAQGVGVDVLDVSLLSDVLQGLPDATIDGCDGDPETSLPPRGYRRSDVALFSWDMFGVSGAELEVFGEGRLALALSHSLDVLDVDPAVLDDCVLLLELSLVVRSTLSQRSRDLHGLNRWRPRIGLGDGGGPQNTLRVPPIHDAFGLWCPMLLRPSAGGNTEQRVTALQTVRVPLADLLPDGPGGVNVLFLYPADGRHPAGDAVLGRVMISRPPFYV